MRPFLSTATLIAILAGILWLLLETTAVPHNDNEYLNLHRWLKEVCRIVFAAAVLAALLHYSQ